MSKPIFLTFILTLIISCATHTPNPSSWLDKRSTPVTQDSICRLISYCQTQANIEIQHGNYAEALYWKDETLRLKDTLLSVRNSSGISHTPMINYSQILLLIIICLFTFSLISLFLYFRHRKLKVQYEKLSETIKHREWSFMMTKEFITENHIAYDELERLLNREKSLHHLSSESYKRLYEALIQQKANSSGRLIYRLTNFDGNFSIRFQRMFPECNTDELLLASMIHHQWGMTDMTTIFHASPEALRKRKNRLAHKISTKLQKEIDLDEFLKNNSQIERYTHVQFTKMSVPRNKSNISVYVYVPENLETFNKDVTLQDRKTKEKYKLTDAGTVISEKTATLTGLKVGDTMTITKNGKNYETKIAAVTENYMGHYIYMTGNVYEQTFGEKPNYSATVFTVKEEYKESESEVGNEILKHPAALSISYTSSLEAQLHRMLGALDTVIIVLIISAGMLAFVVLYNLNNVNITERQRELATLKVLGFYDAEVSAYVYRENVILTFIGVLAGAVFGIFLHRYIIRTVEVDAVMFGRNINPVSFLYCGLLTIGFSMIVNLFMHQKLKKIDMVESLKSVE